MSRIILPLAFIIGCFCIFLALAGDAFALTKAQKLRNSSTVVAWYEGKGEWHRRPGYAKCKQIKSDSAASRCYRHRQGYRWHKARIARLTPKPTYDWWVSKQISAATHLAAHSGADPWPNCPDPGPRDNQGPGHSWWDTVACENGGNWLDSPGYYRCGLQFDPMWENVYGRLCP